MIFKIMHKCRITGRHRIQSIASTNPLSMSELRHCKQCGLKLSLAAGGRRQPNKFTTLYKGRL